MRIDLYLFEYGYAESRARAKFLILEGAVTADGKKISKPSFEINENEEHEIKVSSDACPYVSVGGMKLASALDRFKIDVSGKVCADIGASTGGFTDVLLSRGAERVYAVDSGTSQLHEKLLSNKRVISMENTNARYLNSESFGEMTDIAVCDVSFISQTLILPAVNNFLKDGGYFVTLIKPQFELDKKRVGRGIVTDPLSRAEAICGVIETAALLGLEFCGITVSPVSGGGINDEKAAKRGNREYLSYFKKTGSKTPAFTPTEVREFVKHENSIDTAVRNKGQKR